MLVTDYEASDADGCHKRAQAPSDVGACRDRQLRVKRPQQLISFLHTSHKPAHKGGEGVRFDTGAAVHDDVQVQRINSTSVRLP